jgi:type IV pilus assembly protein PilF
MQKIYRVMLLLLILLVAACSSVKKNHDQTQAERDEKKMHHAAMINSQLGLLYLEKNDVSRAKQKLLLSLEEGPTLPETWYAMGYFLEKTGNNPEAKAHYLKALKLAPKRGDVLNNYGTYLCRRGDYQTAITYFMLSVKDPNYLEPAAAYENAGLCALKIPNKTLAADYFRSAVAQDPNRILASQELSKLNRHHTELSGADHADLRFSSASD